MKKKRILPYVYGFVDWILSVVAWTLFYYFRKTYEVADANTWQRFGIAFHDPSFWLAVSILPVCWAVFYGITGAYMSVYSKSRLKEFSQTFFITLLGVTVLFFVAILNDAMFEMPSDNGNAKRELIVDRAYAEEKLSRNNKLA